MRSQPDVMPVDGQRADRAIAWSVAAAAAGRIPTGGDILLLTDHADDAARTAAGEAARAGYPRFGARAWAARQARRIAARTAASTHARLDAASLRALAGSGGGRYSALTPDDADLRALGVLDPGSDDADADRRRRRSGRVWRDEGYWLLPPLMLLALFAFRRRWRRRPCWCCASCCHGNRRGPWSWWQRGPTRRRTRGWSAATTAYRKGDYAGRRASLRRRRQRRRPLQPRQCAGQGRASIRRRSPPTTRPCARSRAWPMRSPTSARSKRR